MKNMIYLILKKSIFFLQQPQIFSKIPQVFDKILCDNNALVHTKAVESFTQFAESTPHETLVPECIGSKPFLQDIVVAYLSNVRCNFCCHVLSDSIKMLYHNMPPHDKTNNVAVRPAKTQISLGIRPV